MHVNGDGHVVIDDRYVCEFMTKNGSAEFMNACETIIKSVCMAFHGQKTTIDVDEFMMRLDPWGKRIMETVSGDVHRAVREIKEDESVLKAFDSFSQKIDFAKALDTSLKRNDDVIMSHLMNISTRVEQMNSVRNTTRHKGEEGESGIVHILECKLPMRDGYEILETKSKPHNCDVLVKRVGFPDVRVEVKAHGRETGECVRTCEVKRFESDLISLNNHGIFVSLYSGIVGKGPIEIDLLPTNKFAVYVSNNNYDGDALKEFINLIYKLDGFVSGEDGLTISTEAMLRIKTHIIDFNNKIGDLKKHMKNSIEILNGLTLDTIEKLLSTGADIRPVPNPHEIKHTCEHCHKTFTRPSSLTNHVKTCKQKLTQTD